MWWKHYQTTRAGNYIAGQLIKSCHSPTFSYGEAQASESREDFIHKLGIVLKELRWFLKNSILSFPCKRESIVFKNLWIPTFVGITIYRSLLKKIPLVDPFKFGRIAARLDIG